MLVKEYKTEFGFTADKWIITQFPYTRLNETDYDVKIIIECFRSRQDFLDRKASFGRYVLHKRVTQPMTLQDMYNAFKEPILKEVVQEKIEGEETTPIFEDINFFKDAIDEII